jgi:hypothetical protein
VKKIVKWSGTAALAGVALMLSGCRLTGLGAAAAGAQAGPAVVITQDAAPSALVAVLNGRTPGPDLAGLVAETARRARTLPSWRPARRRRRSSARSPRIRRR